MADSPIGQEKTGCGFWIIILIYIAIAFLLVELLLHLLR
jgi:hypothetical protein